MESRVTVARVDRTSRNVTVPVGVPSGDVTFAVRVRLAPNVAGFWLVVSVIELG